MTDVEKLLALISHNKLSKAEAKRYIDTLDSSMWVKDKDDAKGEVDTNERVYFRDGKEIKHASIIGVINITRDDGKKLLETKQIYKNGTITNRNIPVSGKITFTDDLKFDLDHCKEEMLREVMEEIKVPLIGLDLDEKIDIKVKILSSQLYIPTSYTAIWCEFNAKMKKEFLKSEYVEHQEKKTNYFHWV